MSAAPLEPTSAFLDAAGVYGIEFDEGDVGRLGLFLALLLEANQKFNLTAITDPAEAWMKHIFDSLTLLPFIAASGATRVIDVGTGGGLPGVPLAIVLPGVSFTLLEATGKKADFLRSCAEAMNLTNIEVTNDRAETAAHDRERFRESFDVITARAVGRLSTLLEVTIPFARAGGLVLAIKGERAADEIAEARRALHALHAEVVDTHRTPTGTIVVVEKRRMTPKMYPRRPGEPKRSPL